MHPSQCMYSAWIPLDKVKDCKNCSMYQTVICPNFRPQRPESPPVTLNVPQLLEIAKRVLRAYHPENYDENAFYEIYKYVDHLVTAPRGSGAPRCEGDKEE